MTTRAMVQVFHPADIYRNQLYLCEDTLIINFQEGLFGK